MNAQLEVIRVNAESGISKTEQTATYKIGTCKHTNARKAETKVLTSKYRGVFKPLSWVNNEAYNVKTALLKNGDIMILMITPADEDAKVTFVEAARKATGEKLSFVIEKQTKPVSASDDPEVLETNTFKASNERVARTGINKDAKYVNYTNGNWQSLPFNDGIYKDADNGQTIIVLRNLGVVNDSE